MRTLRSSSLALLCIPGFVWLLSAGCDDAAITRANCADVEEHGSDTDGPPPITVSFAGLPCAGDEDCEAGRCLQTNDFVNMGLPIQAYRGMCSVVGCEQDADCGEGAACTDIGRATICAPLCDGPLNCRYGEGYACGPVVPPGAGALPESGPLACVPAGALMSWRTCGDGLCSMEEQADPDLCPFDCPTPEDLNRPTGSPCERNAECLTNYCLTSAELSTLLGTFAGRPMDIAVLGGICASHPMVNACTGDEDCGEGAACMGGDVFSPDLAMLKLCLRQCHSDIDCRFMQDYRCVGAADGAPGGCLPSELLIYARCFDGVCDVGERLYCELCDPYYDGADIDHDCPEDCDLDHLKEAE